MDYLHQLQSQLIEYLLYALGIGIGAVIIALRNLIAKYAGKVAADQAMTMLHRALETGVSAALAASPDATPGSIVETAIDHARASIPDTLKKLAPSPSVLETIAMSKIGNVKYWLGK